MDQSQSLVQTIGIPYYANMECNTIGLDSLTYCFDKNHYNLYPDNIVYKFNSLGYRTSDTFIGNEILAIGDSFTLGLGVNIEDTWPSQLSKLLNYPVLNFSLNGASNDWIARRAQELLQFFNPKCLIIHYTFSHRRERPRIDWHDDERTECEPIYTNEQNLNNWQENFKKITNLEKKTVHSFIPRWHTDPFNYTESNMLSPINQIDFARDKFHYGPKTHLQLATNLLELL
jgi:hypothetical protein